MLTTNDNGRRRLTGERGPARALATGRAVRASSLAAMAFLAAGFGGRSACAQSQSEEVREHCKHAAVEVLTKYSKQSEGDTEYGAGSGYFINRTGLCITNNHVVDPGHGQSQARKFQLKEELGRLVWEVVVDAGTDAEKVYRADVLYQNEKADQALLQVRGEDGGYPQWPYYLKFFPGRRLHVGQKAWCYGFPGGDSRRSDRDRHPLVAITDGHIVDLPRRPDGDVKMIGTDVLANPGNSGGPFVDVDGLLLGTLTLGGQDEGRTNTTKLVPADLTKEFITTAFQRGKVPTGIDLEPFYTHLVGVDGHVDVPGFPRLRGAACIMFESGDRICGSPAGESISLPTPLGHLTLPCAQMAYLLRQDDEYGIILMDGGQRVPFYRQEAEIDFNPTGGKVFTQPLDEVEAVVFRKGDALPAEPAGRNILIRGSEYYLLLSEAEGDVKFATNLGVELSLPVESIATIKTNRENDERVVEITDGSHVSGNFEDHEIRAVLAISGAPQKITLADVREAAIEIIDSKAQHKRERSLAQLLEGAAPDLREMARMLETDEFSSVGARLAPHRNPDVFTKLGPLKKDQLRLLSAAYRWRSGDYREASREFKKLTHSNDEGIKWYAHAMVAVFNYYPDGTYQSQPLSDPKVFKRAGTVVADGNLSRGLEILRERDAPPPENRGAFMRAWKRIGQSTEELMVAGRLGSPSADDALVRIWNLEVDLLRTEIARLEREINDKGQELGDLQGAAREWKGRRVQRDITDLERIRDTTTEWFREVQERLRNVGFIIDDPDKDIH